MLFIVKREKESVLGDGDSGAKVDINTLGFVGTLAVKNQESADLIQTEGPVAMLRQVAATD